MRILFISPRQCWPVLSGARLREYHLLRSLAGRTDLTYVYFQDPDSAPLTVSELPFCRQIIGVPKPTPYGAAKLARGLISTWPLPVLNYTSDDMLRAVENVTSRSKFDVTHLDSIHMIRCVVASTRVVYDWHNIESEAMIRYAQTVQNMPRRWYAMLTAHKLRRLESRILRSSLGHIVCSERERTQLLTLCPDARIALAENGVDAAYFAGSAGNGSNSSTLVFVGTMDYFPNVEAALSFARNVWPRIREAFPSLRLAIVGANPTAEVRALEKLPGLTVTGTVPDVRPWYRDALAAVVPLRTGGGTRLKILEAMAAGVPVISTPLGAEGLAVTPDKNILLADPDDTAAWVDRIARIAGGDGLRTHLTTAALELIRSRYDWQIIGEPLADLYQDWLARAR